MPEEPPSIKVVRNFTDLDKSLKGSVVAIGNFDGLHRGHQYLLRRVLEKAKELDTNPAIITFEPHPVRVFHPTTPFFRITPFREKMNQLCKIGFKIAHVLPFDERIISLSAHSFIHKVLLNGLGVKHVVVGSDFMFGNGRSGNAETLKEVLPVLDIGLSVIEIQTMNDQTLSSTRIRNAIKEGDVATAKEILGRPYAITGRVINGSGMASKTLGFSTANIKLNGYQRPKYGVYAAMVYIEGEDLGYPAAVNIGIRPTVGGNKELLEAHLLGADVNLYGKRINVRLHHFVREEIKFPSLEALKSQISKDIDEVAIKLQ